MARAHRGGQGSGQHTALTRIYIYWSIDKINGIIQGWCGISWALSALSVLEDRVSIGRGQRVSLDPRPLTQCSRGQEISRGQECVPGRVETGWDRLRRHGTWSPDCGRNTCDPGTCHVTRSQPAYRVGRPGTAARPLRRTEDIMWEVMTQGPVQAVLEVHTDLFLYSAGVYSVSREGAGRLAGHLAVRITGWGETGETGELYWVVTNSWGADWGERGVLRVRRDVCHCHNWHM